MTAVVTRHADLRFSERGIDRQDIIEICSKIKGIYQRPKIFTRKSDSGHLYDVIFFDDMAEKTRVIITGYISKASKEWKYEFSN